MKHFKIWIQLWCDLKNILRHELFTHVFIIWILSLLKSRFLRRLRKVWMNVTLIRWRHILSQVAISHLHKRVLKYISTYICSYKPKYFTAENVNDKWQRTFQFGLSLLNSLPSREIYYFSFCGIPWILFTLGYQLNFFLGELIFSKIIFRIIFYLSHEFDYDGARKKRSSQHNKCILYSSFFLLKS